MHEVVTELIIDAPAQRVWTVLTSFAEHPAWNPFVRRIEGQAVTGNKLNVSIQPPGGRGMTFSPVVLKADPNRELRWLGRFLLPGIFDGEHYFIIEPVSESRVRFIHGERFKGILVALMKSSLDGGTRAGFEAMNQALKARAESAQ
ncbi:MAG: SRPBCC domain-containing protein [Bryobacteraceae bacterium]|nr:SRPBCC domain-containing protein [Bryobacteraceae bacterium]